MTTFPTTNIRWDDNEKDGMDNNSTHVETTTTTTTTLPSSAISTIAPTVTVVSDIEIHHPLLQTDTDGATTSRIQQHGTPTCSTGDDGTSSTKVPIRILETISTATTAPPATTTTTAQPKTSAGTVATNSSSSSSKNDSVDCSAKRKAVEMEDVDHSSTVPVDDTATTTATAAAAGLDSTATTTKRLRREVPARISWDDRIQSLMEFQSEHGHLNIPIRYKKNPSLGKFVHNTREQYKLYHHKCKPGYQKRCSLSAGRIAELDALGFLWTTDRMQRQNEDWAARLEQLKEYKAKHGDCLVPHGYDVDPSFAEWIHRQRTAYAAMLKEDKPNPLVQSRMVKLEEIGFNFTVHSDKWMDHWQMLKVYKEKHGDCQVPTHYAENPKLGRWTHTQRHQRRLQVKGKKSCITNERVALLDQLGFSWEVRPALEQVRATWQQRYDELREFHLVHGHFHIPANTHPKLLQWSHEQRTRLQSLNTQSTAVEAASRRMGLDRVKALEELGFTKDTVLTELHNTAVEPTEMEGNKMECL